jgi:flagellar biosynthesis/type III secretory pathway protein FliH
MEKIIKAAAAPKVVKKDAYAAILDAVTILATARDQAQAIREEARHAGRLEAIAAAEPEIVRLATAIARKIVAGELRTSSEAIGQIVRDALASVRHGREVVVKANPSDVPAIRMAIGAEIEVRGLERIEPGGCLVESEFGVVDAQLETKFRAIERGIGDAE